MFFRGVNWVIDGGTAATGRRAARADSRGVPSSWSCSSRCWPATYWVYNRVPTGFVPDEDQGYIFIIIQAPQGASLDYTMGIEKQVEQILAKTPEISHVFGVGGFGFAGSGPNQGIVFCMLKDFPERPGDEHSAKAVVGRLFGMFSEITGRGRHSVPAAVDQRTRQVRRIPVRVARPDGRPDRGPGGGSAAVGGRKANRTPGLTGVFTQFTADDPQLIVTIDREQAKSLGISLGDITDTMQILLGSSYVNDFDFNNRSYRVYVQADQQFRSNPSDIERYYVRTAAAR